MKQFLWGSRKRRVVASILALLLLASTAAIAALIIYSGTSGSGSGTFENSSTVDAITITGTSNPELVVGGPPVAFPVNIANNDPNTARAIAKAGFTVTFSSPVNGCAGHLSMTGSYLTDTQGNGIYSLIGPGGGFNEPSAFQVQAAANTPLVCAGAAWSVTFDGNSTP